MSFYINHTTLYLTRKDNWAKMMEQNKQTGYLVKKKLNNQN